jgi:hypothetical protein
MTHQNDDLRIYDLGEHIQGNEMDENHATHLVQKNKLKWFWLEN